MSLRCQGRRSVPCIEPVRSLRRVRAVCLDNCRKLKCPRCGRGSFTWSNPPWRALSTTLTHCVHGVCRRCSIDKRVPTFDTAARVLGSLVVALHKKLPSSCLVRARATCLRSSRVHTNEAPWLILPVVICLSQRLSHACLSACRIKVKPRMAH